MPGSSSGQEENRHRVGVGLGYPTEGVLRPGTVLSQEYADVLAVIDAGESVGHVDAGTLLPAHNGADSGYRGSLDERIGGHAAKKLGPFQFQNIGYGGNSVHSVPPSLLVLPLQPPSWIAVNYNLGGKSGSRPTGRGAR